MPGEKACNKTQNFGSAWTTCECRGIKVTWSGQGHAASENETADDMARAWQAPFKTNEPAQLCSSTPRRFFAITGALCRSRARLIWWGFA